MFIQQVDTALYRSEIRMNIIYQYIIKANRVSTGPLGLEKWWKWWESQFINYMYKVIGKNIVPLSSVVREHGNPYANGNFPHFFTRQ